MLLISDTSSLEKFCQHLRKKDAGGYITVDTEFVRTKTYWSKLCLVQIAGSNREALIDPLAVDINLSPLQALLQDEHVLKVFHSGRQDLEIFYRMWGKLPQPIFDTQIVAMVCGYGDSVGYDTLVQSICRKKLDKSFQFTDWARRPLSGQQKSYALRDVTYLRAVYQALKDRLERTGRQEWIAEDIAQLQNLNTYEVDVETIWQRIKTKGDQPRFLARLQAVAEVRELEAQRRNKVRHHVVKDLTLIELAVHPPQEQKGLSKIKGLSAGVENSRLGRNLWKALQKAEEVPLEQCPKRRAKSHRFVGNEVIMDILQLWLKNVCRINGVAAKLVATTKDLENFVYYRDQAKDLAMLQGWRYELFGRQALELISGEKAITFSKQDGILILMKIK